MSRSTAARSARSTRRPHRTRTHRTARIATVGVAAVSAGAIALGLSGCAFLGPLHEFSDSASVAATVAHVTIDSPDDSVEVRGVAGATGVSIERTVRYRGPEREIGDTHRVDGDELVLGGCGRNCSVAYTVEVPVGVDVSGETSNGELDLEDVGEVDVETSNGRIELTDVAGSVSASTSNGAIVGRGLAGHGIDVDTSNGEIDLELVTAQDVAADTSNGSIEITVPDAAYRVDAHTSNGSTDIGVADDPDGEFELVLGSSNGAITVSVDD
ncbi:DUF4097 domain-containing protein [Agromyces sp. MMS24-JH15]|uniref:DUF4097 family beta strand repeat-containing protein n=1 Tax=Agromyces sp. MMS24-JH15 TaxID=3243765 RepID=UPI003749FE53